MMILAIIVFAFVLVLLYAVVLFIMFQMILKRYWMKFQHYLHIFHLKVKFGNLM